MRFNKDQVPRHSKIVDRLTVEVIDSWLENNPTMKPVCMDYENPDNLNGPRYGLQWKRAVKGDYMSLYATKTHITVVHTELPMQGCYHGLVVYNPKLASAMYKEAGQEAIIDMLTYAGGFLIATLLGAISAYYAMRGGACTWP